MADLLTDQREYTLLGQKKESPPGFNSINKYKPPIG